MASKRGGGIWRLHLLTSLVEAGCACGVGNKFFGVKVLSNNMPGRKVLSHLHVVTWRRTRSTQRLVFTGLASGGIITPD